MASINIAGSIYAPNEPAVIYTQVLDNAGNPVNTAVVTLNLLRVDGTAVLNSVTMTYIPLSNGIYQYGFTAPAELERLVADVSSALPTAYGVGDIYVPQQASIAANIAKIRKYYDDRTSIGKTLNFPLNNITQVSQEVRCPYLCQSLYLENNGPGQIFVAINSPDGDPTPIPITRAAYVDFETHKIQRFYVWSAAGTVATAIAMLKY